MSVLSIGALTRFVLLQWKNLNEVIAGCFAVGLHTGFNRSAYLIRLLLHCLAAMLKRTGTGGAFISAFACIHGGGKLVHLFCSCLAALINVLVPLGAALVNEVLALVDILAYLLFALVDVLVDLVGCLAGSAASPAQPSRGPVPRCHPVFRPRT